MSTEIASAGRIVVGTDGSQRASKAVEWAADRAVARKLPLLVVFTMTNANILVGEVAGAAATRQRDQLRETLKQVEQLPDNLRAVFPGLDVSSVVVEGTPAEVLARASRDAELVVVGARGETAPLGVRLLGGVSDAVAAHSVGPVAVISDDAHENPAGPVVVGVDDSEPSRAAVRLAFEAATVRGVPLILYSAFPYGSADFSRYSDPVKLNPYSEEHRQQITAEVLELAADEIAAHPDVPVEVRVEWGRPQDVLVEASRQAGLLVVGSRGRGGFRGLLLGSTSKHVIRAAHCPVIITRGQDAEGRPLSV